MTDEALRDLQRKSTDADEALKGQQRKSTHTDEALRDLQRKLAYDDTFSCVQCGYCLPVCPTYETMGTETHSPRGRINLVKMTAEGKLTDWSLLADSIDRCLGCRACETACPTGVKYGNIFESAKAAIAERQTYAASAKAGRSLLFRGLFPSKRLLNALAGALWVYQKSGLETAANKLKLTRVLPRSFGVFATVLPRQPSPFARMRRPRTFYSRQGKPRYRVAFFTGCIMDAMFERINRLGMELLAAGGCEVVAIPGETCCGALHAHAGERDDAIRLAKRNIEAFERLARSGTVDYVVNNAGGCGAMLDEYPHLLRDDPKWHERAQRFAEKSRDISVVLAQLVLPFRPGGSERAGRVETEVVGTVPVPGMVMEGVTVPETVTEGGTETADGEIPVTNGGAMPEVGTEPETVTYQRSCHMTNVQKVTSPPLRLIQSIPGIQLQEMADKDKCCGSAGIYNMIHYDESMAILDVKMKAVHETRAQTIVTTNPGCLLQMQLGIQREGLQGRVRAVHLVELLAEACGLTGK